MRIVIRIILYIAAVPCVLFLFMRYLEAHSVYFPSKTLESSPLDAGLAYHDVFIKTSDSRLIHSWFLPVEGARRTLLFLHGNAGNISHRIDKLALLSKTGVNILIIDYRGYGKSSGLPSEQGLYRDAQAGYGYLVNTRGVRPEEIVVYGESLGTSVAVDLVSRNPACGLILEGAFSSGRDMGKTMYPLIPEFFLPRVYDSYAKIPAVLCPVLFIHSSRDEIVPLAMAKKLFAAARGPKEFFELGGGHNDAFMQSLAQYEQAIGDFMKTLTVPSL